MMNWNDLKKQIDAMTPEQREMEIAILDCNDDILTVENEVYYNTPGKIHLTSQLPTNFLYSDAPYLVLY